VAAVVVNMDLPAASELAAHAKAWGAAALLFMGSARAALKPFNARLQQFLARAVTYVRAHGDGDANAAVTSLLASPSYRAAAFTLDYLVSLKLPTLSSLPSFPSVKEDRAQAEAERQAPVIPQLPMLPASPTSPTETKNQNQIQ
jgi:hypothetical protein